MRKMNWTHCSRLALGLGLVLALALVAGTLGAAAVPFEGETPDSAEVGEEVDIDGVTMTEPYDVGDQWTMRVSTELAEPRLRVTTLDGAGNTIDEIDLTNGSVVLELNDTSISEVVFDVRGDVPGFGDDGLGEFSYANRARENLTVLEIEEVFGGQTRTVDNGTFELHRFTPDSREARQAIDNASAAAEEADSDDARDRIDEAITFYDNGEFGNAIDAANDAESTANSEGETRQTLLLVGGVVALLVAVGGVAYFLRSRQEPENKLQ
jgi:hypothetical protein